MSEGVYGREYQLKQADKYRNRNTNRWSKRIQLAFDLCDEYVIPRLNRAPNDTLVADIGCSIGTFAIEFAKRDFNAVGIDFDPIAIEVAKGLAKEEGVEPEFLCEDLCNFKSTYGKRMDVAICFDIFEHLHDDQLGVMLYLIKENMASDGYLVFHTYPTQFDYIFQNKKLFWPLIPFAVASHKMFERVVYSYASFLDMLGILFTGKTRKEKIKHDSHCNPLSENRLRDIFDRAGLVVEMMKTENMYGLSSVARRAFGEQPVGFQNIFGVLRPAPA